MDANHVAAVSKYRFLILQTILVYYRYVGICLYVVQYAPI